MGQYIVNYFQSTSWIRWTQIDFSLGFAMNTIIFKNTLCLFHMNILYYLSSIFVIQLLCIHAKMLRMFCLKFDVCVYRWRRSSQCTTFSTCSTLMSLNAVSSPSAGVPWTPSTKYRLLSSGELWVTWFSHEYTFFNTLPYVWFQKYFKLFLS